MKPEQKIKVIRRRCGDLAKPIPKHYVCRPLQIGGRKQLRSDDDVERGDYRRVITKLDDVIKPDARDIAGKHAAVDRTFQPITRDSNFDLTALPGSDQCSAVAVVGLKACLESKQCPIDILRTGECFQDRFRT